MSRSLLLYSTECERVPDCDGFGRIRDCQGAGVRRFAIRGAAPVCFHHNMKMSRESPKFGSWKIGRMIRRGSLSNIESHLGRVFLYLWKERAGGGRERGARARRARAGRRAALGPKTTSTDETTKLKSKGDGRLDNFPRDDRPSSHRTCHDMTTLAPNDARASLLSLS